jgi:hypothetical protein
MAIPGLVRLAIRRLSGIWLASRAGRGDNRGSGRKLSEGGWETGSGVGDGDGGWGCESDRPSRSQSPTIPRPNPLSQPQSPIPSHPSSTRFPIGQRMVPAAALALSRTHCLRGASRFSASSRSFLDPDPSRSAQPGECQPASAQSWPLTAELLTRKQIASAISRGSIRRRRRAYGRTFFLM